MPSVIDICNSALDKLGQSPIMSLTDGNTAAKRCNRNWPLVRDKVLRDHPWNFAVKRDILAPSSDVPSWGFGSRFPFPTDLIRLLEIDALADNEYQVEGRSILADGSVLRIRYIYRVVDPNLYDTLFADAVANALAFEMCEAFSQSSSKKTDLERAYKDSMEIAKSADAQENPPVPMEEDSWIAARY